MIAGSTVILTSLTSAYEELANVTGAPDVKVYPKVGNKDYENIFTQCESVSRVTTLKKVSIKTLACNGKDINSFIDVVSYNDCVHKNIRILSGSLTNLKDGTCVMPAPIANTYGLAIGDTVQVQLSGHMYEYKIAAIYAEIYSAATEFICDMIINALPEDVESTPVYGIWLQDQRSCDDFIQEYTKDNNGIIVGNFKSKSDCIINSQLAELAIGGILLAISLVVFLSILFILGYIVKNCFQSDMKTIAIYKTIGYCNAQIRRIYITFYLSIIGAGAIVGAVLSPILSNSFIKDVYKNIGVREGISGIGQIICCLIVICSIAFFMLEIETRRLAKMKPVDILCGTHENLGKKKIKSSQRNHYRFSPLFMAIRMMHREKRNTILLILTCVVSLYIVNLSIVCLQNIDVMKGNNNYYWLGIDKHDITIENNGDKDKFYKICNEIKSDSNVLSAVRKNCDLNFAIPYHQVAKGLVYENFDNVEMQMLEGHNPQYPHEVAIGNRYLKELGIQIGDYITLQLDQYHREELLVVGTYQGILKLGRSVKIMGTLLEDNHVDLDYTQCSITLKDGVNVKNYMNQLTQSYSEQIKVIDRFDLYASAMNTICEPQKAALMPFAFITVVIGALNAFYIIFASNIEKRKKYTIYKSLGYTSAHLLKMNCIYIGLIVMIAIAIAVPAFVFLFPKVMVLAMSAVGFAEYSMDINELTLVLTNLGMLGIFLLTACIAAVELYKNHIGQVINE
jgi:putative ABC transport system permease protein